MIGCGCYLFFLTCSTKEKKKATTTVIPTEGDNQNFLKAYHSILISLPNYTCIVTGGPDFILGFSVSVNGFLLEPFDMCGHLGRGTDRFPKPNYLAQTPSLGPTQPTRKRRVHKRNKAFRVVG